MNVETLLTQRIGEAGKRLHTGRSRNDQVALDTRMYAKAACRETEVMLEDLLNALLDIAGKNLHTIMPGYTHMQKAQPITLAHHLMAYVQMFLRDRNRFRQAYRAADVMVLGSGALAGTTYPLNRERVAELLGFAEISENSLDGVSDRDYMLDYLSAASICMMHLSRFCEELILWNTNEFRFVEMDDGFATGSSIMPQKKNPDVAELIRGKTGRVYGHLMGLLTVMKGLPLAYNKDMQEDKEAFFDARDTLVKGLTVFTAMLKTVTFRRDVMERGASGGFTNATDCADYLVKKGVAFRDAHKVVGELVAHCLNEDKALLDLSLEELKQFHPAFEQDVFDDLSMKACVEKRRIPGAPAPEMVERAIAKAREELER
jgi:argininosuccinate lyase